MLEADGRTFHLVKITPNSSPKINTVKCLKKYKSEKQRAQLLVDQTTKWLDEEYPVVIITDSLKADK